MWVLLKARGPKPPSLLGYGPEKYRSTTSWPLEGSAAVPTVRSTCSCAVDGAPANAAALPNWVGVSVAVNTAAARYLAAELALPIETVALPSEVSVTMSPPAKHWPAGMLASTTVSPDAWLARVIEAR